MLCTFYIISVYYCMTCYVQTSFKFLNKVILQFSVLGEKGRVGVRGESKS